MTVLDGGTAPNCPVDCPIQFEEGAPPICEGEDMGACRDPVDSDGYFPTALELVAPPVEIRDEADRELDYPALFVGGLGSDTLVEIKFEGDPGEEDGRWEPAEDSLTLTLERARGVHGIRATPPMLMSGGTLGADFHQFLYVIAGDGATHVVDRDFSQRRFGNECDTQIDPTVTPPPYPSCNAIDPATLGQTPSPDRRPFAVGPGIRASLGAAITDWAFYKLDQEDITGEEGQTIESGEPSIPFDTPGVVGVGVTSFGRVVLSVFNQLQAIRAPFNENFDPVGIMNASVPPHSLWPSLNPYGLDPSALPLVDDNEPDRALPGAEDTAQSLSPSLRRIDLAYADAPDDDTLSEARQALADSLGNPVNADALGSFDGEGLYENEVARVVVRDYQQYQPLEWALAWEGSIPGTRSATGRLECDSPGWENGTCRGSEDNPSASRLVDESAAFCDAGVLPGDKIVLLGCTSDDDCGLGQRCLQEPTAPSTASGICVSAQAYDDDFQVLRQVCAPFINEACGDPRREYLVTDAFQNELWLRAIDRDKTAHIVELDPENADNDAEEGAPLTGVTEFEDRYTCELPYSTMSGAVIGPYCTSDAECAATPETPTCVLPPADSNGAEPPPPPPYAGRCACERDRECRGGDVPQRCVIPLRAEPEDPAQDEAWDPYDADYPFYDFDDDRMPEGACRPLVVCAEDADCQVAEGDEHICDGGVCRGPCTGGDPECFECADRSDCAHYGPESVCSDGMCMRPCESGDPDCTRTLLPGPRCFPELVTYVVRLRHSFMVEGSPTVPFIPDRVVEDPETGRCREDPSVSTLLTSRIRLGADESETFSGENGYPYVIPECPNADEAAPTDPNPCRINRQRAEDEATRFHTFSYDGERVSAIRFSNPFLSLVVDMTDLRTLGSEIEQLTEKRYGPEFVEFRRGRLPRGYRETFLALPGYVPFSEPLVVRNIVMVYPVRIIKGPETSSAFIVDAGGRGGPMGVRGQLIRIIASAIDQGGMEDLNFLVR